MNATDVPQVPDWIYPGAEVVIYETGRDSKADPVFYTATVGKIAKLSFVVGFRRGNGTDDEERIYLRTLESKDFGGAWKVRTYRVVEPTAEIVARMAAKKARNASRYAARRAMADLIEQHRDERMDDLDLLRTALQAIAAHADLVLDQDGAAAPLSDSTKD